MKKLLAIISVILFASGANAETRKYEGVSAEIIMMYGEVIKTLNVFPLKRNGDFPGTSRPPYHETLPSETSANYHIKLMPKAIAKMRSEQSEKDVNSIKQGIYLCLINYTQGFFEGYSHPFGEMINTDLADIGYTCLKSAE